MARMLIDRGDIVLIADSQGVRDIYSADGNALDKSTPLVVLVNRGTASASEVRGAHARQLLLVLAEPAARLLACFAGQACTRAQDCREHG